MTSTKPKAGHAAEVDLSTDLRIRAEEISSVVEWLEHLDETVSLKSVAKILRKEATSYRIRATKIERNKARGKTPDVIGRVLP